MMKVYVVVGNQVVFAVTTDKEKTEEIRDWENYRDEMGGGWGNVARIVEKEVE